MDNLTGVVRLLKKEQDRLTKELRGIGAALAAFGKVYGKGAGTRKLSASARARIAAAQRARWAKVREKAGAEQLVQSRRLFLYVASGRSRQLPEGRSPLRRGLDGRR
jgi:hypothetical protein